MDARPKTPSHTRGPKKTNSGSSAPDQLAHVEEVEVRGHIIDSLILPKILDVITAGGGAFRIKNIAIGQSRHDPSYALVEVRAASAAELAEILAQIADHGAVPVALTDCVARGGRHSPAPFPKASTARRTSGPKFASAASGSRSPNRRWTAASSSIARNARPAACR